MPSLLFKSFLLLSLLLLAACQAAPAAPSAPASAGPSATLGTGLPLTKAGKPAATIVLADKTLYDDYLANALKSAEADAKAKNPTLTPAQLKLTIDKTAKSISDIGDDELLAANELQSILKQISGATLPIVRLAPGAQLPAGTVILIGPGHAKAQGYSADLEKLKKDGILLKTKANTIILAGPNARGTLYAAYDLLQQLGCRWTMPGPFGEIYPSSPTVSISPDKVQSPSHSMRYWWCTFGPGKDYGRWTLRNKGNFVRAIDQDNIAQGHALGAPLRWGATQAKYDRVERTRTVNKPSKNPDGTTTPKPVEEKYMALADEYFSMHHGKVNTHFPNMANPKTWDLYADYYIDFFNKNPGTNYVSISAEDGIMLDERPASAKLRSNEFDFTIGAFAVTDQLWFFHNRVIPKVLAVHPTKKFGVLVYANNTSPPRIEHVNGAMALIYAPLDISPLHHIRADKEDTNRAYKKWLEDWSAQARAVGAEQYYYDYEPLGYSWNVAMICPRWGIIGKNYPWLHELGLNGHTTQGYDDWGSCGLDNYLMQQLYWDIKTPYQAVIKDYCAARFGAAGPAMEAYYAILEDAMDKTPELYSNEVWGNHLVLTPDVRAKARAQLTKAVPLADSPRAKAQIQTMVDLQASTDAYCNAIEHAHQTGDYAKAVSMMDTSFAIAEKLNKLYSHFMNPNRMDKTSNAQFLTGGYTKQYGNFAQQISSAKASVVLPRFVKGMNDTGNIAWAMGYQNPGADVSKLEDIDTTVVPDVKYQTQRTPQGFFYRTDVDVPATFKGQKVELFFPAIVAKALQVWINGKPVSFEHDGITENTWRGPEYFWMNYDHRLTVDVTSYIKPGEKNTIAFRAFKSYDFGGTYERVFLLAR
jgi:hypothetical protein